MSFKNQQINDALELLEKEFQGLDDKRAILRSKTLKALIEQIKIIPKEQKASFGKEINELKQKINTWLSEIPEVNNLKDIDVTAPFDANTPRKLRPELLNPEFGTVHPLMTEFNNIVDIFNRMGFVSVESRQLDDDYHMFGSLNFPDGHPARDDYDTFMTKEGLIAPAHTSTMQNRVLKQYKDNLKNDLPIAVLIPGRVFRNEDLDATHEHTFYQFEGVYVGKNINVGNLTAVLKAFMSEYFGEKLDAKIQPFYFPFTEPSFEFAVERPEVLRKDNSEAEQWLELGGCGMIHPNVLKEAGIDSKEHSGFAWGWGIERLVMMKYGIEDIRHFESGKLDFLRQFK